MKQTISRVSIASDEAVSPYREREKILIRVKKHFIAKFDKLHKKWQALRKLDVD